MASVNKTRQKTSRANRKIQTRFYRGGSDEAARLFPQQRILSGQDRVESQGPERKTPAASPSQGRTMRAGLSGDQSAGAGPDPGGRRGSGADPVARHHRM